MEEINESIINIVMLFHIFCYIIQHIACILKFSEKIEIKYKATGYDALLQFINSNSVVDDKFKDLKFKLNI